MEGEGRCWKETSNGAGFLSFRVEYEVRLCKGLERSFVGGLWEENEKSPFRLKIDGRALFIIYQQT